MDIYIKKGGRAACVKLRTKGLPWRDGDVLQYIYIIESRPREEGKIKKDSASQPAPAPPAAANYYEEFSVVINNILLIQEYYGLAAKKLRFRPFHMFKNESAVL